LYFLRQYKGAVEAYQDALKFEQEDNHSVSSAVTVTRAYLQKAKEKLAKQEEKELRKYERGAMLVDDNTVVGDESVNPTVAYSIATDKERVGVASGMNRLSRRVSAAADAQLDMGSQSPQLRDLSFQEDELIAGQDLAPNSLSSPYLMTVETGPMGGLAQQRVEQPELQDVRLKTLTPTTSPNHENTPANDHRKISKMDEPDPDFDEALRLQCRATHFLNSRKFITAVDEFSAALFLVPDDPILTPQLHVGRAYALNGQERFESAKNDALMALKHILRDRDEDVIAAEAYSVLGRSLYYSHDYNGSIESFEESQRIRINYGVKLSVIDKEYIDLCREALDAGLSVENDDGLSFGGGKSVMSNGVKSVVSCIKEGRNISNIPRLKPPRFVPREKVRME
jgi:tetratricopeptide (TPR) repeat protein